MVRAVSYLSRLAIAFASLCILSPSGFAGESNPPPLTEYASPAEPRKVEKEPRNKPERPLISRLVAQPVGACVGTMVAVPVKVVRTVRSETKRMLDTIGQEDRAAIPILSQIPIIGYLFKSKARRDDQTELLVLVTPRLVRPLNPDEVPPMPTIIREPGTTGTGRGGGGGGQKPGGGGVIDAPLPGAGRGGLR